MPASDITVTAVFGTEEQYLLTGVTADAFAESFTVTAYWVTLDGTVVNGREMTFKINEHYSSN